MAAAGDKDDESSQGALLRITDDDLEEALKTRLAEIVPEPKKQEVTRVVHEVVASFHGPLPPPSMLHGYDEVSPGAADRIILMAEKEQTHRHLWEQRALSAERWYSMIGMLAGWTVAIALAVGAVVAAIYDQAAVGLALAAASATGMVWKADTGAVRPTRTAGRAAKAGPEEPREQKQEATLTARSSRRWPSRRRRQRPCRSVSGDRRCRARARSTAR